jgi:hypothetical protein
MLETYFHEGAILDWAPPGAINNPLAYDGSIVASGGASPTPLSYVGHAGVNAYQMAGGMPLGRAMHMPGVVPYTWVNYVLGRTGFQLTQNDILTGHMSGCWIFMWTVGGRKVGHLGTVDTAPPNQAPNTTVKDVFWNTLQLNPLGLIPPPVTTPILGYQPHAAFSVGLIAQAQQRVLLPIAGAPKIYSLVTGGNSFYSVLLIPIQMTRWICAGRTRVMPVTIASRAQLG